MAGAAEKYKAAMDGYSSAQRSTNDKTVLAAKKKLMDDAAQELAAEREKSGAGTQGPSLMDMMFGRKNPPKK